MNERDWLRVSLALRPTELLLAFLEHRLQFRETSRPAFDLETRNEAQSRCAAGRRTQLACVQVELCRACSRTATGVLAASTMILSCCLKNGCRLVLGLVGSFWLRSIPRPLR
jgi:hypothetical protein